MLQASSERAATGAAAAAGVSMMRVPGMSPLAVDHAGSARAREIARKREEMLGMLHDLPESEYELSLTDLVEKAGGGGGGGSVAPPSETTERKEASPLGPGQSASGRQAAEQQQQAAARTERRGSSKQWGSGSSFRSSSDGVLLNFYMPRSITRSFTAPRPGRTPSSVSGGRTPSIPDHDCNKRERDGDSVKCWPLPWDRRRWKSSRRDLTAPPGESTVRAAILKAAEHSATSAKV